MILANIYHDREAPIISKLTTAANTEYSSLTLAHW